jgi:hypothetical protein
MASQDEKEMRDLLVRLDESVKIGFEHINKKLDEMTRRADGHETRIRSLEDWRTEFKGGTKAGKLIWAVVGAAVPCLLWFAVQVGIVDKDKPVPPPTTSQSN